MQIDRIEHGRKKNPNEVAIWPILTCIGEDLVSGPPENKSTPCSEWVWAAKYCQSANNSIKLVINHIWAISFSFLGPTRNRDIWKIYALPNWSKLINTQYYYINTNEIPGELSRENLISSRVKITCYLYMWKYHRCYGYIIDRAFHTKNLLKWNGLVVHWCSYNK